MQNQNQLVSKTKILAIVYFILTIIATIIGWIFIFNTFIFNLGDFGVFMSKGVGYYISVVIQIAYLVIMIILLVNYKRINVNGEYNNLPFILIIVGIFIPFVNLAGAILAIVQLNKWQKLLNEIETLEETY